MQVVLVVHRYLAYGVVGLLLALLVLGIVIRLARRDEAPTWYWALQHWTENVLLLNVVVGLVLLAGGRRIVGELGFLHYLYGSLFPLVAIVGGRLAALRREVRSYVGLAWGAFFAVGLVSRALLTGLGIAT